MAIGSINKISIFIVREVNEPPTAVGDFTDYSDYFIDYKANLKVSSLSIFEGIALGITTTAEKLDFKEGNTLYLLVNQRLIGKFVIERPKYGTDYSVTVRGIQSTGTSNVVGASTKLRRLAKEATKSDAYKNEKVSDILDTTSVPPGVLRDPDSADVILAVDGTNNGGSRLISVDFDYANRIRSVKKIAAISEQEWIIDHGLNDLVPFDEGDILNVLSRVGLGASQKTFYIETSSGNQNALAITNDTEDETTINYIAIEGHDILGNPVVSEIFEATGTQTTTSGLLDSWLDTELDATSTSFNVKKNSNWEALTPPFLLRIQNEIIKVSAIASGGADLTTVTATAGRGFVPAIGDTSSSATIHKVGSDVVLMSEDDDLDLNSEVTVNVGDTTGFSAFGELKIGGEPFEYISKTATTFVCVRRSRVGPYGGYSHGDAITVYHFGDGIDTYTPGEPDTSTTNSITSYGIHTKTFTENSTTNQNSLDQKAQGIIEASKELVKNIVIIPSDLFDVLVDVRIGDTITINDGTIIDFPAGGPYNPVDVRVMGIQLKSEGGLESSKLFISGNDARVYDLTDQSFSDSIKEEQAPEIYEPSIRGAGKITRPRSDMTIYGNIVKDPSVSVASPLSFSIGTLNNQWDLVFTDSVVTPSAKLDVAASSATDGQIFIQNVGSGTTAIRLKPSTQPSLTTQGQIYSSSVDNNLYYYDGTSWVDLTAAGGSSLWQTFSTGIQPGTSGFDVFPNGTADLGSSATRWDNIFLDSGVFFDDGISTASMTIDGNGNILVVTGSAGKGLVANTSDQWLGTSGNRWGFLYVEDINANGNVTLGSTGVDNITCNGQFNASLIPDVTTTYNLGAGLNRWNAVFMDSLDTNEVISDLIPDVTGILDLGSSSVFWSDLYVQQILFSAADNEISYNTGSEWFEFIANGAVRMRVGSTVDIDAHVDLGATSASNIAFTGTASTTLNMGDNSIDNVDILTLGTGSGTDWTINKGTNNLVIARGASTGSVQFGTGGTAVTLFGTGGNGSLGTSGTRWLNIYGTNIYCTNQTAINYVTGALSEGKLLSEVQSEALFNGEKVDTGFKQGEVLSWKGGKLVKCSKAYDKMVMAVAESRGYPMVIGAEPVLVVGPVKEGDYLVTSPLEGHAMAGDPKRLLPGMVIGQALEDFEGSHGLVKAMIRKF